MMWEHRTTLTGPNAIERTLKALESNGWQICAAITVSSGLVELIHKREHSQPRSPEENDQAFQDLIKHHHRHHLRDEAQDIQPRHDQEHHGALAYNVAIPEDSLRVTGVRTAELEDLQSIRSRAEKELMRSKPASAVWQSLRWVLGVTGAEPAFDKCTRSMLY